MSRREGIRSGRRGSSASWISAPPRTYGADLNGIAPSRTASRGDRSVRSGPSQVQLADSLALRTRCPRRARVSRVLMCLAAAPLATIRSTRGTTGYERTFDPAKPAEQRRSPAGPTCRLSRVPSDTVDLPQHPSLLATHPSDHPFSARDPLIFISSTRLPPSPRLTTSLAC